MIPKSKIAARQVIRTSLSKNPGMSGALSGVASRKYITSGTRR
jgi:hypothetical protein